MLDTIQRKIDGQDITGDVAPSSDTKMLDLMEALKASLAKEKREEGEGGAESKRWFRELLAGTSGYRSRSGKGAFLPEELKDDGMLATTPEVSRGRDQQHVSNRCRRRTCCASGGAGAGDVHLCHPRRAALITHYARSKGRLRQSRRFSPQEHRALGDRLGRFSFSSHPI